jgi:hypothetical protein
MDAESKAATEEGMRQVAEAMKAKMSATLKIPESDISLTSGSDSSDEIIVKKTRRISKKDSNYVSTNEKLETRIHYLKLDNSNLYVELMDLKSKHETLQKRISLFVEFDCLLTVIKDLSESMNSEANSLTESQLTKKLHLFNEQMNIHIPEANSILTNIPILNVRTALHSRLIEERTRVESVIREAEWILYKKILFNTTLTVMCYTIALTVITLLSAFIYLFITLY